jgi:hypothetical protein
MSELREECRAMKRLMLPVVLMILSFQVVASENVKRLFDVTLQDVKGGGRTLDVGFYGKLPPPNVVDEILRGSLEHAILLDPRVDILATGFIGEDTLNSNQYSGSLVYKAREKKIVTLEEYRGVKTTGTSTNNYFVEIQEEKTYAGKPWLSVTILFSKQPSQSVAYDAIITEVQKLVVRGMDVSLYVSVGNQKVKTSWKQMRDKDGAYVFAEYDSMSKKLLRKGKLLEQLP